MRQSEIRQMLRTIERECELAAPFTGRPALAPRVLRAMADVPREQFVPSEMVPYAYADNALPIGSGQTISQPYVVAEMARLARPPGGWAEARVLEVGTGRGYAAAILAEALQRLRQGA